MPYDISGTVCATNNYCGTTITNSLNGNDFSANITCIKSINAATASTTTAPISTTTVPKSASSTPTS